MNRLLELEKCLTSSTLKIKDFHHLRSMSTINDKEELKKLIFGQNYDARDKAVQLIRKNMIRQHYHITEASREHIRHITLKNVFIVRNNYPYNIEESLTNPNRLSVFSNGFVPYDMGYCVRAGVHVFLYLKSIYHLGTQKHQQLLDRGKNYQDIGCFGLTELTHGSNVKGILTQAHYVHSSKQFIINTPSKQGMKFWIGAAGQTANMAVIWAQLYIKDKCYGVHAFVVPIRDLQTHRPLPGVTVGDCGPKMGLNGIDNGFMLFDKVRIPATNLLDRISGVDQNGNFRTVTKNEEKRFALHMAPLSGGRFFIANNCATLGLEALTIGIRYSAVRRQFNTKPNEQEKLLIEYPLTQRRLMPLLAQTIVYLTASMKNIYDWDINQGEIQNPSNPIIESLHAISTVMKAQTSWFATECIKESRQICGGHGYNSVNKLGVLYNDNDINVTWQGDNNVILQQTTKYVLEQAQKILQKGQKSPNPVLSFLANPPSDLPQITKQSILDLNQAIIFLQFKLFSKVQDTGMHMLQLKQQKLQKMDIWNNSQVFLGQEVALTYGNLCSLTTMIQVIKSAKNKANHDLLTLCTRLWILRLYRKDEYIENIHDKIIDDAIMSLSQQLATESLGLLEAIFYGDDIIGSPLADQNGNGLDKYLEIILSKPTNQRPEWWKIIVNK